MHAACKITALGRSQKKRCTELVEILIYKKSDNIFNWIDWVVMELSVRLAFCKVSAPETHRKSL